MRKGNVLFFLAVFVFIVIIYFPSLNAPFYYNDEYLIEKNIFLKNTNYFPLFFRAHLSSVFNSPHHFRPLLMISYALNYFFGGLKPYTYRLVNIIIHFLVAIVFYGILKTTNKKSPSYFIFPLLAIFLLHPVNTETINYITARSDLLATLFLSLALLFWLNNRLFLSFLLYIFSLFSKETGLCFSFLIAAYIFLFPEKRKKKNFIFLFFIFSLAFFYLFIITTPAKSPPLRSFYSNFLTQSVSILYYLRLFIFPNNLNLIHNFPEFNSLYSLAGAAVLTITFVIFLLIRLKRRYPILCLGLLWYLIGVLPFFYARFYQIFAEYRFYLPSLGLYLIVFSLFKNINLKGKKILNFSLPVIIFLFSFFAFQRNIVWADEFRFYQSIIQQNPFAWEAYYSLAKYYYQKGKILKAESYIEKAYSRVKKHGLRRVLLFMGGIYLKKKDFRKVEAILLLDKKLSRYPFYYILKGKLYYEKGDKNKSFLFLKEGLRKFPLSWEISDTLAWIYFREKEYNLSIKWCEKSLKLNPDNYYPYFILGEIFQNRDLQEAEKLYNISLKLNPRFFYTYLGLSKLYIKKGKIDKSFYFLDKATILNPEFLQKAKKIKQKVLQIKSRSLGKYYEPTGR